MSPHGCKDVVQLNIDCREGKESSNQNLERPASVPWDFCRNLSCNFGGAGWSVEIGAGIILGHDSTKNGEREGQENEKCGNCQDGGEWKGACRPVGDSNRIDPQENGNDGRREQRGGQQNATNPVLFVHLPVKAYRSVS
mmetsp:Transcript_1814/g.3915  ORF Transcript_1814/g.3915 Transcript_1814/m.3915 type:complete len:139 (+) Transcript_1814:409-825(+)